MKQHSSLCLTVILLVVIFVSIIGCNNQGKATGKCETTKIDGLWNCKKSDCTGKCMLQVGTIDNKDTTWKDIPGGNLNPDDLKENQIVRCDCR